MKATPGASSAIADPPATPTDFLPGPSPLGWPAPYAEADSNPWIGQLLVGLPLAVAVLDAEGRILAGNEALGATVNAKAWRGLDPVSLVIEEDRALFAESIRQVIKGGVARAEARIALLARPNEKVLAHIACVPPGLGVSAMLALPDVREQLRLEAQVRAATRMQAVGQLAGGIAHDFNNILTAVLALSDQIAERNRPGTPDGDAAAQIGINGRRAAALVAQLLAFARRQPQRPQLLDLTDLLRGLEPLLRQLVGKRARMSLSDRRLPAMVRADPGQIEQVIVNLVVNARDAIAATGSGKGQLDVLLSMVPAHEVPALGQPIMPVVDHVALEVHDTGTGIPADIAGKIFEPFFTTKKMGEGTGLGLSTVYGIVKQSSGFIFAKPRPGGGTVFSVYLPAVARPTEPPPPPPAAPAEKPMLSGLRLLICEDEDAIREILMRGMRRHGLFVEAVCDADLALAALASGTRFDALLTDVMMPGVDGVELARRAQAEHPALAVLLMSGFAEPPLHEAAATAGIGFIAKPFTFDELLAGLADAVEQARPKF
ncbi:hybrid sensor histidine kinase/response regulator [Polymorphobacter sp.]|uniref:hybrid sensor histidine kinase/response regulator n=1 Tax=Polymorphobacter sp. TaxID=1909290 RepID=UPI003F6F0D47